jgi:uncharacterized protein YhbP (UPF0306 family)
MNISMAKIQRERSISYMGTKNIIQTEAFNFLKDSYVAIIATSFECQPHATAIYYDIDDDFNIFYLTKRNTQKNVQTKFNPLVAAVVMGPPPQHITAQIRGRTDIMMEPEKSEIISRMIHRYSAKGILELPIQRMEGLKKVYTVAFKLVPEEIIFMNMGSTQYPKSISKNYHRII